MPIRCVDKRKVTPRSTKPPLHGCPLSHTRCVDSPQTDWLLDKRPPSRVGSVRTAHEISPLGQFVCGMYLARQGRKGSSRWRKPPVVAQHTNRPMGAVDNAAAPNNARHTSRRRHGFQPGVITLARSFVRTCEHQMQRKLWGMF